MPLLPISLTLLFSLWCVYAMEANLRTTDLDGVAICYVGFAGDIGECVTGKKKEAEECVEVFHSEHPINTVNLSVRTFIALQTRSLLHHDLPDECFRIAVSE